MRDPKRIDGILKVVGKYWKENPDLRLGQLILNVAYGTGCEPYYIEDKDIIDLLKKYYGEKNAKS